ncbi:hypothetical protein XENOCAPTIV_028294, partial [Xenoophorus captivus]
HRAINFFIPAFERLWIEAEEYSFEEKLVQDLAVSTGLILPVRNMPCVGTPLPVLFAECFFSFMPVEPWERVRAGKFYFAFFSHLEEDPLYIAYADMMAKDKKQLTTTFISLLLGRLGPMVTCTLKLGISILNGGNVQKMLDYLKEKRDAGFFKSLSGLMQKYWDLECRGKANFSDESGNRTAAKASSRPACESYSAFSSLRKCPCSKVLQNDEFTKDLFRFLQLLCEGHNGECKGIISKKEFQKSMESQKQYNQSEIEFLLSCAEADENDMFNYKEFVERFHEPAKDIGFNVAVLLTNLSEHMPHDSRLATFLDLAESVLSYFEPYLGRIEILGSAKRIERVYFEISESSREQWEKPQVKESKRQFIFDVVNEGGESEKMEMFVNFCEDTIFEMQLASQISEPDAVEQPEEEEEEEVHSILEELSGAEDGVQESASAFTTAWRSVKKKIADIRQIFTIKTARKQFKKIKKLSIKELITGFFYFFWMISIGFFKGIFSLIFGFFHVIWSSMFGGGLVEGAKNIKVTDILGNMPDPTQFGIHGDVGEGDKVEAMESSGSLDKAMTPAGDSTEVDAMLEMLTPKKEGGKHVEPGLGDVSELSGESSTADSKKVLQHFF